MCHQYPAYYRHPELTPETLGLIGKALGMNLTSEETTVMADQIAWNSPWYDQGSHFDREPMMEFVASLLTEQRRLKEKMDKGSPDWKEVISQWNEIHSEIEAIQRGGLFNELTRRLVQRIAALLVPGLWWLGKYALGLKSTRERALWLGARVLKDSPIGETSNSTNQPGVQRAVADEDDEDEPPGGRSLHLFAVVPYKTLIDAANLPLLDEKELLLQCHILGGLTASKGSFKWLDQWHAPRDEVSFDEVTQSDQYLKSLPADLQSLPRIWYVVCGHGFIQTLAADIALRLLNGDCLDWHESDRMGRQHKGDVLNFLADRDKATSDTKTDRMRVLADRSLSTWNESHDELLAAASRYRRARVEFDNDKQVQYGIDKVVRKALAKLSTISTPETRIALHNRATARRGKATGNRPLTDAVKSQIDAFVEQSIRRQDARITTSQSIPPELKDFCCARAEARYQIHLARLNREWLTAQQNLDQKSEFIDVGTLKGLSDKQKVERISRAVETFSARTGHTGLFEAHRDFATNCTARHSLANWQPANGESDVAALNVSLNEFFCRALWNNDRFPLKKAVTQANECRKGMVISRVEHDGEVVQRVERQHRDDKPGQEASVDVDENFDADEEHETEYVVTDNVARFEKAQTEAARLKKKKRRATARSRQSTEAMNAAAQNELQLQAELWLQPGRTTSGKMLRVGLVALCQRPIGEGVCGRELRPDNIHDPHPGGCSGNPNDLDHGAILHDVKDNWRYFVDGDREPQTLHRVDCSNPECPKISVEKKGNPTSLMGALYFLSSRQVANLQAARDANVATKKEMKKDSAKASSKATTPAPNKGGDVWVDEVVDCLRCGHSAKWNLSEARTVTVWMKRRPSLALSLRNDELSESDCEACDVLIHMICARLRERTSTADDRKLGRLADVVLALASDKKPHWTPSDISDNKDIEQKPRIFARMIHEISLAAEVQLRAVAASSLVSTVERLLHKWLKLGETGTKSRSGCGGLLSDDALTDTSGP